MIETVARALYECDGLKHADGSTLEQSWADSPRYHEDYRRRAIAAIKAMGEPSEAMIEHIAEQLWSQWTGLVDFHVDTYVHGEYDRNEWRRMARIGHAASLAALTEDDRRVLLRHRLTTD